MRVPRWPVRMVGWLIHKLKVSMSLELFRPGLHGAGPVVQAVTFPVPDAFERLPVNLSADEIRAMVRELLG